MHLPELDMIVWVFPNDPVLLHLPECIHPEAVKRHLPYDRLPAGLDGAADIVDITSEVVHYRPEARCTTRYRVRWGSPDEQKEQIFFGKTFSDDRGREIHRRMEALWKISSSDPKSFMVAEPLAYQEEIKTVWQAGLNGDPFVNVIERTNDRPLLEAVAEGLARFHKSDLYSPVRITLDDHLAEIRKKISKLMHAFPGLRESLQSLDQNLTRRMDRLTPIPYKIIHGDFTVQQLLVCEGRIAFFDFDEFAIGDPTQDIANFIVDLHFRSFDRSFVEEMKVVFFHAYQRRVDWPLSADRLHWHLQIQFITKAYRIYIQQRAGMEKEIKEIIVLAQEGRVLEKV
ncbi:MAG: aminoglycoside phosphotransferase family protein [Candidatus Manganitrophus sp. SA1]|nr:aminoglycoside phosphotransferase family protein [Candidatus Manganitrophus morganii]